MKINIELYNQGQLIDVHECYIEQQQSAIKVVRIDITPVIQIYVDQKPQHLPTNKKEPAT